MRETNTEHKADFDAVPFYRKKRYMVLLILAVMFGVLFYFCFVPSPLVISPETTGITEPFNPDGTLDYFGAYQKIWEPKLSPPEDNGQRDLIIACGPAVLEQGSIVDTVPWVEFPVNEKSKDWFETYWKPLCEAMLIDPAAEPPYLKSKDWYEYMSDVHRKAKDCSNFTEEDKTEEDKDVFKKLIAAPWTANDADGEDLSSYKKETAKWLEERSPVLEIFSKAVRKKNFQAWRKRDTTLLTTLIPDCQSNRKFIRDLQIRITERLGRSEQHSGIDGALYDVMSILHFAAHYKRKETLVEKMVGCAAELSAFESAQVIFRSGTVLTREQLANFAAELNALPDAWDRDVFFAAHEKLLEYDIIQSTGNREWQLIMDEYGGLGNVIPIFFFCTDKNIIGRTVYQDMSSYWDKIEDTVNPSALLEITNEYEKRAKAYSMRCVPCGFPIPLSPLIRHRSQTAAGIVISLLGGMFKPVNNACIRAGTQTELLKIAAAIEIYQRDNNQFPDKLDELVPKYLPEIPLDPFTGKNTLTYHTRKDNAGKPDAEASGYDNYILYSYSENTADDGGLPCTVKNLHELDIVFRR